MSIPFLTALLGLQPLVAGGLAATQARTEAEFTLYMFGASWCSPCIAELRDMTRIAAATLPGRIVIVWEDSGIRQFTLPRIANVAIARDHDRAAAAALRGHGNAGLPFAAMVDTRGRKCAEWRSLLTAEVVRQLRKSCTSS